MDFNNILNSFDNYIKNIDNNKILLLIIIAIIGIYTFNYNKNISSSEIIINIFSNYYFKFAIFVLITYISSSSPALGLSLAIAMLVTLQIVTNLKIKNELNENFNILGADPKYLDNEYLTNPLLKEKDLSPPVGLNLKIEGKNQMWYNMINKGRKLLDESLEIENDLVKRYDSREKNIADITKRNGLELIESGLNRLENSNQGEISSGFNEPYFSDFVKYNELMNNFSNNPEIKSSYLILKNKFNNLTSNNENIDKINFDNKLNDVYQSELDFLKSIYDVKKQELNNNIKKEIETLLIELVQLKQQNKQWGNKLSEIINILS